MMRSRAFRISLLVFTFVWFEMIVPGHRRGIVLVPGSDNCPACAACCACQSHAGQTPGHSPASQHSGTCAICDFAAHLTIPPSIDLTLPPHGFLARLDPMPVVNPVRLELIFPFDGRGPPIGV